MLSCDWSSDVCSSDLFLCFYSLGDAVGRGVALFFPFVRRVWEAGDRAAPVWPIVVGDGISVRLGGVRIFAAVRKGSGVVNKRKTTTHSISSEIPHGPTAPGWAMEGCGRRACGGPRAGGPASAPASAPIRRSSTRRFTPSIGRIASLTSGRRVVTATRFPWTPPPPSREYGLFGANRGPRPSADGLASPTKMKTFWVIKYLNIYSTNK